MRSRSRALIRLCGLLLLLLAISPVTAPFSTYDLGVPASQGSAAFQSKPTSGEPAAAPGAGFAYPVRFEADRLERAAAPTGTRLRATYDLPLRI